MKLDCDLTNPECAIKYLLEAYEKLTVRGILHVAIEICEANNGSTKEKTVQE